MSPTSRTLAFLRKNGWIACVVERWIAQRGIRIDCFHFADILAAHPGERRMMLVQVTTLGNVSARVRKVQRTIEAATWLASGGHVEIHGWAKVQGQWRVKRIAIDPADMQPVVITRPPRRTRGASAWQPAPLFGDDAA